MAPLGNFEFRHQRAPSPAARTGGSDQSEMKRSASGGPDVIVFDHVAHGLAPELGPGLEDHAHPRCALLGDDPTQEHGGVRITGKRQSLSALDDPRRGHPPVVPDERTFLVETAPDETMVTRRDGVQPGAPNEVGKNGIRVPRRGAHPGEIAPRTDQDAAPAVGQQGIVPQYVGREFRVETRAL